MCNIYYMAFRNYHPILLVVLWRFAFQWLDVRANIVQNPSCVHVCDVCVCACVQYIMCTMYMCVLVLHTIMFIFMLMNVCQPNFNSFYCDISDTRSPCVSLLFLLLRLLLPPTCLYVYELHCTKVGRFLAKNRTVQRLKKFFFTYIWAENYKIILLEYVTDFCS